LRVQTVQSAARLASGFFDAAMLQGIASGPSAPPVRQQGRVHALQFFSLNPPSLFSRATSFR